jgi:hypothetical protein
MNQKRCYFRSLILGVIYTGLCGLSFSAFAYDDDDDSTNDADEDIKGQIATVQGLPIPKTEFEIQAEITETKQKKTKTESAARQLRRRAKSTKEFLAKPENQPAKHKAQMASVRAALEEKIRNNTPMEKTEFVSLLSNTTLGGGAMETDHPELSDGERNAIQCHRRVSKRSEATHKQGLTV